MWNKLGISAGTGIIILIALYFVIKWGVKNGIQEFFEETNMLEKLLQRYERLYEKREQEGDVEEI